MAAEPFMDSAVPLAMPSGSRLKFLASGPIVTIATICLTLVVASAIFATWLAPHDPLQLVPSLRLKPPSAGVSARHRRLWPRSAVAHPLWRPDLAADRHRRRRDQHRHRPRDRPGVGVLQMDRRRHHAHHGRPDGDPQHPAGHRRDLALRRQPQDGSHRNCHSGNSARGAAGPIRGAVRPRRALCGSRICHGIEPAEDPVAPSDAQYHRAADRPGHLHLRFRHPDRGDPVLPGRGNQSGDPDLGQHHGRRPRVLSDQTLADLLAGAAALDCDSVDQSDRRCHT